MSVILITQIPSSPPCSSQSCSSPPVRDTEWQQHGIGRKGISTHIALITGQPVFPGQEGLVQVRCNLQPTTALLGLASPPSPTPPGAPMLQQLLLPLPATHKGGFVLQQQCSETQQPSQRRISLFCSTILQQEGGKHLFQTTAGRGGPDGHNSLDCSCN